jgi:hypothetical protein
VPAVRGVPVTSEPPQRRLLHYSRGRPLVVVREACLLSECAGMLLAVLQHPGVLSSPE